MGGFSGGSSTFKVQLGSSDSACCNNTVVHALSHCAMFHVLGLGRCGRLAVERLGSAVMADNGREAGLVCQPIQEHLRPGGSIWPFMRYGLWLSVAERAPSVAS